MQQARSININYTDLANSRLDKSSHACTRDASKSWHCTLHRLQRGVARCVPRTGNTQARNKACARQSVAQLRYWSWPELVSVSVFSFWRFRRLFRFDSGKFTQLDYVLIPPRIDKQKANGKNYTVKLWNNFGRSKINGEELLNRHCTFLRLLRSNYVWVIIYKVISIAFMFPTVSPFLPKCN